MIALTIDVKNLDELRSNFAKAPALTLKYLAKATKAAIFEVEKQAVDRNFQFRTPRIKRTGQLSLSFAFGRKIDPSGLRASIGPTVYYAPMVYFGTRLTRPNAYMDRIAAAATPEVERHFVTAVDLITTQLAQT